LAGGTRTRTDADWTKPTLDGIRNAIYRAKLYWFYGNLFAGPRIGETQQARPAALEWMLGASGQ